MKVHIAITTLISIMIIMTTFGCGRTGEDQSKTEKPAALQEQSTDPIKKQSTEQTSDQSNKESRHKVIIDTDTGADDASALILAAKSKNLDILGVTVLVGNVDLEQGARNALMALEMAGSDAPVYKGASENYKKEPIEAFSVFGKDGMGEADLIHPKREAEKEDAVDFILDTVKQNPGEIEIVALGPATNIAKAIEKDPETMKKVRMIWSMGTAGLGPGNASPVAEFNVFADPEAYKVMLDSGIDITVVGLDVCGGEAQWTNDQLEQLNSVNEIGSFVTKSFTKIREFYAANGSADSVMNCDSLAMMCLVHPEFVNKTLTCHGSCITEEGENRAQVIFYQEGFTYDGGVLEDADYNITLVNEVDAGNYFNQYYSDIKE